MRAAEMQRKQGLLGDAAANWMDRRWDGIPEGSVSHLFVLRKCNGSDDNVTPSSGYVISAV